MLMYGRSHHNIVIILQLKIKIFKNMTKKRNDIDLNIELGRADMTDN